MKKKKTTAFGSDQCPHVQSFYINYTLTLPYYKGRRRYCDARVSILLYYYFVAHAYAHTVIKNVYTNFHYFNIDWWLIKFPAFVCIATCRNVVYVFRMLNSEERRIYCRRRWNNVQTINACLMHLCTAYTHTHTHMPRLQGLVTFC